MIADDLDEIVAALHELVACKDLKERIIEMAMPDIPDSPELTMCNADYKLRQPVAWANARAVLAAKGGAIKNIASILRELVGALHVAEQGLRSADDKRWRAEALAHIRAKISKLDIDASV